MNTNAVANVDSSADGRPEGTEDADSRTRWAPPPNRHQPGDQQPRYLPQGVASPVIPGTGESREVSPGYRFRARWRCRGRAMALGTVAVGGHPDSVRT